MKFSYIAAMAGSGAISAGAVIDKFEWSIMLIIFGLIAMVGSAIGYAHGE